jgi:SAM-dependent methyltransferase
MSAATPNADQIAYWNEQAGPRWVEMQERLDRMIGVLGMRALERAALAAGESVLDVGCGCGGTTLEIARRVAPGGRALGLDISRPMLARARARAASAGAPGAAFVEADAQTVPLEAGAFDAVFSRFGVMFFADPVAAFANLRRALRPGGRLTFVCWQRLVDNPWVTLPLGALAKHLPLPAPPPPGAPGPFAFADAERVRELLAQAGFAAVACEPAEERLALGGDLDDAVALALELGPSAAVLREAGAGEELRAQVAASIREALASHAGGDAVRLPSAAWIVSARTAP